MKPMYNVNEIVSRLDRGESLENIATELTTALNEAKKVHDEQKKIAQEKELAQNKRADLREILIDCVAWIKAYYPEVYHDVADDMTVEEAEQGYDMIADIFVQAMDKTAKGGISHTMDPMTMMLMGSMFQTPQIKKVKQSNTKTKTEDDVLNDFLKSICH